MDDHHDTCSRCGATVRYAKIKKRRVAFDLDPTNTGRVYQLYQDGHELRAIRDMGGSGHRRHDDHCKPERVTGSYPIFGGEEGRAR